MTTLTNPFLAHLSDHVKASYKKDALQPLRQESWERLQLLGLASKSQPSFRHVSLRDLYAQSFALASDIKLNASDFQQAILPECKHSHLVFVNGRFSLKLSDVTALPDELVISSLEQGLISHGGFLLKTLQRAIRKERDPFSLLNLSLSQEGVFFYSPPHLQIETPLQVLHITTGDTPSLTTPRLQLVLGQGSKLSCVMTSHQMHPHVDHFVIPSLDVLLEENAHFHLSNLSKAAWNLESIHAILKKDAQMRSVNFTKGSRLARQSYWIELKEEGAEADLSGLSLLDGSHAAHTHVLIEHQAPHTRSMQLFKGVLNDLSRSSFSGKIYVEPIAQKTLAYQLNKTLLLSPNAQVTSEPNLEIGADDVKASHGSTITQLDDKQLFYFNARGINKELASLLLIEGFCKEILHKIPYKLLVGIA